MSSVSGNVVVNVCYKRGGQVMRVREVKEPQIENMDTHQVHKSINVTRLTWSFMLCWETLSSSKTESLLWMLTPLCTVTL